MSAPAPNYGPLPFGPWNAVAFGIIVGFLSLVGMLWAYWQVRKAQLEAAKWNPDYWFQDDKSPKDMEEDWH